MSGFFYGYPGDWEQRVAIIAATFNFSPVAVLEMSAGDLSFWTDRAYEAKNYGC